MVPGCRARWDWRARCARRLEDTKLEVVGVETLSEALGAMFD